MTPETSPLKVDIDPKVHFLVKIAARYKGVPLARFVESAIKLALTDEIVEGADATPGTKSAFKHPEPLWNEQMWDEDDRVRLFNVAMLDSALLTQNQNRLFTHVCAELAKQGKKVTRSNFVNFIEKDCE